MSQTSVLQFLDAAKKVEDLRDRLREAVDAQTCVDIAQVTGYSFTCDEFLTELSKMSEEEMAEIVNPGIAPRRHLLPH